MEAMLQNLGILMTVRSRTIGVLLASSLSLCLSGAAEAQMVPTIVSVPTTSAPALPSGLKLVCLDSASGTPVKHCPMVKYQGNRVFALSYDDNRMATALVAFDKSGKAVVNISRVGARYVFKITSDGTAHTLTFTGQDNKTVSAAWSDLAPK